MTASFTSPIAFIGGGTMASAIIGGLLKEGLARTQIDVVEPFAAQPEELRIKNNCQS